MGRPNVGKSALFNRITGSGAAIVYDYPGVTRDCQFCRAEWSTTQFMMIDTGGLMNTSQRLPPALSVPDIRGLADQDLPQVVHLLAHAFPTPCRRCSPTAWAEQGATQLHSWEPANILQCLPARCAKHPDHG